MRKKIIGVIILVLVVGILSGCGQSGEKTDKQSTSQPEAKSETNAGFLKKCSQEKVALPNYGDPGKRLSNCFVEYPGEPSRQDKSYYIVEDICGQFTQEFMENMLGQKLAKIELPKISGINNCTYYFDDEEYVMLNLEYLKVENQKIGNKSMGRKVEKEAKIPMDNLVVYEEDGAVNVIYLILNPEKFISIRPSSIAVTKIVNLVDLASNMAKEIKNYK